MAAEKSERDNARHALDQAKAEFLQAKEAFRNPDVLTQVKNQLILQLKEKCIQLAISKDLVGCLKMIDQPYFKSYLNPLLEALDAAIAKRQHSQYLVDWFHYFPKSHALYPVILTRHIEFLYSQSSYPAVKSLLNDARTLLAQEEIRKKSPETIAALAKLLEKAKQWRIDYKINYVEKPTP